MSYNGSGTFQINTSGQPVVTGTVISSSAFNALTADLANGLSTAITKDGQTATTARIPFAQGINSTLTTDSTSGSTGSIFTAGGVGIAKALFVGTTLNYGGVTLSASVTGTGKMVLDNTPTLVTPILGVASATSFTLTGTGASKLNIGTTAERPTGAAGLIRYNSSTSSFEGYTSAWGSIGGGAKGGGSDQVFYENGQTVTTDYTITAGQNAGTFGPVTINSGITVTVPSGSNWSVV